LATRLGRQVLQKKETAVGRESRGGACVSMKTGWTKLAEWMERTL
jgi:hypothetical protein